MEPIKRKPWSFEELKDEALKYASIKEFKSKSPSAYHSMKDRYLTKELCSHMTRACKPWTKETLILEAKKYDSEKEFRKKLPHAHARAKKLGILDEICAHMKIRSKLRS